MSFEAELKQEAMHIAQNLQAQNLRLRKEIADAELVVANLVRKAEASSMAHERALKFTPLLGGEPVCPMCWVTSSVTSILVGRSSPDDCDVFACNVCNHEFVTPVG